MDNTMLIDQMVAHLAERHIKVPRDWLVALRDWVEENEPEFLNNVNEAAYLHVLQTNLNVFKCGCLPPGTANVDIKTKTLKGNFFLQVNSVMDISQPAYRQLRELDTKDFDSEDTAVTEYTFTEELRHSSRTLSLELTDGVQVISGMEWQPMPFLSVSTKPGCKILVYGEVECRRGILLLCPENTKYLDGEVDELTEVNSRFNLLKREVERSKAQGGSGASRHGRCSPRSPGHGEPNVYENRLPYVYPSRQPSVPSNRRTSRSASRRPYSYAVRRATASPFRSPRGSATGRVGGSTSPGRVRGATRRRARSVTSRRPRSTTSRRPRASTSRGSRASTSRRTNISRNQIASVSSNPPPIVMQSAAATAAAPGTQLPFGSDEDDEQFLACLKYCGY